MRSVCTFQAAILLSAVVATAAGAAPRSPVVHHDASVRIDVTNNLVEVVDAMNVPASLDTLRLNRNVALDRVAYRYADGTGPVLSSPETPSAVPNAPADTTLTLFVDPERRAGGPEAVVGITAAYSLRWVESTSDVRFSRENVGREISGTVTDEGVYLSAGASWLPLADGALNTYRLTVITPAGWEPVTQGRRVLHAVSGDTLTTVWEAVHPSDGLTLIANRYHVTQRDTLGVTAYTYFLEDDPALSATYLERTGAYLAMYDAMLGPYPFAKFATVENWFPTGYGFPSWTLLGGQVLRLPFIPYTSFGHEICHDWWGNSVLVDASGGNWCEGLTVYCADYHYKELESPAAAREYRRTLLKDYASYVRDGRDLPLREFRERHSGATRAIGYGKSMMVFHMIDRMIGRDAFVAALQDVVRGFSFREASWNDFLAAFGKHGGRDLTAFGEAWLGRTGAPLLKLDDATRDGDRVTVRISQDEPAWPLEVPVVAETSEGPVAATIVMEGAQGEISFEAPGATAVAVDPDDDVFRRLYPEEIEPTLSQVLGDPEPRFVLPDGSLAAAAQAFAQDWIETGEPVVVASGADPEGHARILVNPDPQTVAGMLPAGVEYVGGLLFLDGERIDPKQVDVALAVAAPGRPGAADLIVLCSSAPRLKALAGRLSHYGKYSHLVFPASGPAEKGNWETSATPLRVVFDQSEQENRR